MYKVIIVDDEPLILAGIASMVSWDAHDCRIVGKASNGQKALELMQDLKPDVIITDIKMPSMDGITFIKKAREQGDTGEFIILTNLEEFALAREAIRLGAVDYLVKMELTEEKLIEVLERAKMHRKLFLQSQGKSEGGGVTTQEQIEQYFYQQMLYETGGNEDVQILELVQEKFRKITLVMVQINDRCSIQENDVASQEEIQMLGAAKDIIREMVKHYFENFCVLRREKNVFLLVISVEQEENYKEIICTMAEKFCTVLKDYFEVTLTIAGSGRTDEPTEFFRLFHETSLAMKSACGKIGIPVFYSLDKHREHCLDKYVEMAVSYVEHHYMEKINLSQVAETLNISVGYLSSNFKKQTGKNFTEYVMEQKIQKAGELILERKYMLYEISDMLGFDNQFYFSKVFKKYMGCAPKEYESMGGFRR